MLARLKTSQKTLLIYRSLYVKEIISRAIFQFVEITLIESALNIVSILFSYRYLFYIYNNIAHNRFLSSIKMRPLMA